MATIQAKQVNSILDDLNRDGYVVVNQFLIKKTIERLKAAALRLMDAPDASQDKTVFNSEAAQRNEYFLESADKIRFFYEKDAFDNAGNLVKPKHLSINKIGHALHKLDPTFKAFSESVAIKELLNSCGLMLPKIVQSMYLCKQPSIGDAVKWHQDSTYLYTNPETCIGLWFALEDATIDNGCLWVIPGAHKGPLRQRYIRHGNETQYEILDDTPFDTEKAVPVIVPEGSLVILHGRMPHQSRYNTSLKSRHAYTLHAVDSQVEFAKDNWLKLAD